MATATTTIVIKTERAHNGGGTTMASGDTPRLWHYSEHPLTTIASRAQRDWDLKPQGLWLSVEDAWAQWCREEGFELEALASRTRVEIVQPERVLTLATAAAVRAFTGEYGEDRYGSGMVIPNWHRVAERFAGVAVQPYHYGLRWELELLWYNGMDCASVCVWDAKAVRIV